MRFRTTLLLLAVLAFFATTSNAQSRRSSSDNHELTVFGGLSLQDTSTNSGTLLWALDPAINTLPFQTVTTSIDGSAEFGARYGYRLTSRITVEADFSVAPSHTLAQRIEFSCPAPIVCIAGSGIQLFAPDLLMTERLVAFHYGGGVRLALTDGPVRPSIVGGLGAVTVDGADFGRTRAAVRLGAAVTADAGPLATTIEVVDVIVADHFVTAKAEHDVHVRFGIGVRWN